MTTLKDIAKQAGVSVAAVSYVINGKKQLSEETTRRIEAAISESNYSPHTLAKSLRMGKTQTIGVLVEDVRGLPTADIVNGVEDYLETKGYQMILNDLHMLEKLYNQYDQIEDFKEYINDRVQLILRSHVDGIIYVGLHDRHIDTIINPITTPFVFAYSHGTCNDHYVTYNNFDSAINATNYLIEHGHREIAVIAGHPDSFPTHERMKGFVAAMEKAGLPVHPEFVSYGDWEYESGYRLTQQLLTLPHRPSAIFVMNDLMAAGSLNSAQQAGLKIPQDLSIIGFDNREIARYLPVPLTTVQLPNTEIGRESARMLLSLVEGTEVEEHCLILPCSLIERASVASLPTV
jgi:LacI family transcriptional regulator